MIQINEAPRKGKANADCNAHTRKKRGGSKRGKVYTFCADSYEHMAPFNKDTNINIAENEKLVLESVVLFFHSHK